MAIIGGTTSELGGGKFSNGAMGSAFQYLFNDLMDQYANKAAFPSEKTRVESAAKVGNILDSGSTLTGLASGFALSIPTPMSKLIGLGLGTISSGLMGMKHLNAAMTGNFRGEALAADIFLDKTQYVRQPFMESVYDTVFGKVAEEFGK
jgi:hypothetical protein